MSSTVLILRKQRIYPDVIASIHYGGGARFTPITDVMCGIKQVHVSTLRI